MILDCAGKPLNLSQPQVMGILNVTPDSFSDGGRFNQLDTAIAQAELMVEQGAAIIDVGGESTRPGAEAVTEGEELARVLPVIEALAKRLPVPISIDTSKATVIRQATGAGAGMINDVCALRDAEALAAAVTSELPVCLMHMQGEPRSMQAAPQYQDVVTDVLGFLQTRAAAAIDAGVPKERILIDPGFGFGKTLEHNLTLLRRLQEFTAHYPLLVGLSRKSMLGALLDAPVDERLMGSVTLALIAAQRGAAILRVHDVKETVQALTIWQAAAS